MSGCKTCQDERGPFGWYGQGNGPYVFQRRVTAVGCAVGCCTWRVRTFIMVDFVFVFRFFLHDFVLHDVFCFFVFLLGVGF